MPFSYDNSGSNRKVPYSETGRTFDTGQDWTRYGVKALSLWFYGDPNNLAEPMYLAVEESIGHTAVVYHDDPNAVLIDDWTEWNIDLKDFADQGVNLTDVSSIAIGFGDRHNPQPGGTGTVYFDNITLCAEPCATDPWEHCYVVIEITNKDDTGFKAEKQSPYTYTVKEKDIWDLSSGKDDLGRDGAWIWFKDDHESFKNWFIRCNYGKVCPGEKECKSDTQFSKNQGVWTVTVKCDCP
jgi:hypothetical protein